VCVHVCLVLACRFDWFFKSRTPPELQRRADTLIRLIEKELEDENVSRTATSAAAAVYAMLYPVFICPGCGVLWWCAALLTVQGS